MYLWVSCFIALVVYEEVFVWKEWGRREGGAHGES